MGIEGLTSNALYHASKYHVPLRHKLKESTVVIYLWKKVKSMGILTLLCPPFHALKDAHLSLDFLKLVVNMRKDIVLRLIIIAGYFDVDIF